MASQPPANPLVSRGGSSELQVILHPLVLLTISDYIARHTLREMEGQVTGALLGQQNGREITIEHAFDVGVPSSEGPSVSEEMFSRRLEQSEYPLRFAGMISVGANASSENGAQRSPA